MRQKLQTLLKALKKPSSKSKSQPEWTIEKTIENIDAKKRLEIFVGPTKTYKYQEAEWLTAHEWDKGRIGEGYWNYYTFSGHYETLESCELEARQAIIWLRDMSV